ncbi:DUF4307 domain-containing protein [Nocardiopsis mangrovi]|uniref:DUF4307 domain-containing protein n=1 Tax=Nocardiopsis mangrovi TaxID=1179818 RepID=A0ABV9DNS9_9ACTN
MPESPSDVPPPPGEQAPGAKRRHGNKPVIFIIGVLVAGVFTIGWGSALLSYGGAGGVSMQTVAWRVLSDAEATITFQVNSGEPVECLVTATDAQHVEVGQTSVEVEAGLQDVTTSVETIREASAVQVASCREQGSTK